MSKGNTTLAEQEILTQIAITFNLNLLKVTQEKPSNDFTPTYNFNSR